MLNLLLTVGAVRPEPATVTWARRDPLAVLAAMGLAGQRAGEGHASAVVPGSGEVRLSLPVRAGERFYGLGERMGSLVLNGQVVDNWAEDRAGRPDPATSYSPMPFLLSSAGYGLLLDTTAMARFDLRRPDRVEITVYAPWVIVHALTGADPTTVLGRHAALCGLAPVPPPWGLGVWKSLIGGTDRVRGDLARLRAAGVPLDAVWIYDAIDDASGWGWLWPIHGAVPPGAYLDLPGLVGELHAADVRVLGYLNPFVVPGRSGFAEASVRGFLVRDGSGAVVTEPWTHGERRGYVDFTSPAATAWWQDRVRHALAGVGFDGAMQDYGEDPPASGRYANGHVVHNTYPALYARAAREAAESVRPGATVLFARSGYSGSQASVTGRFTGDQYRSWDRGNGIGSVLPAMLSGSVSGWPYWGPDIGGFFDGDGARDVELWTRWVQLGALSPVMRDMLGAQSDPVGALSSADTLATFAGYARLHRALVPYLHGLAQQASRTGAPLMRPLWLAAPTDPVAWRVEDAYLLGPDLLVAPVVTPGARERLVYLPAGRWRDYWTGAAVDGGRWVRAAAPVLRIPLFLREGSDLVLPAPAALRLPG